jgi:hypothetical protein
MVNKKQPKKEEKKKKSPNSDRTGVGALWRDLLGWMAKSKDKRPSHFNLLRAKHADSALTYLREIQSGEAPTTSARAAELQQRPSVSARHVVLNHARLGQQNREEEARRFKQPTQGAYVHPQFRQLTNPPPGRQLAILGRPPVENAGSYLKISQSFLSLITQHPIRPRTAWIFFWSTARRIKRTVPMRNTPTWTKIFLS